MNVYGKQNVDPSPRGPIPEPLPAGQLPPDDSPMWLFTPDAVRSGEQFIQADTIEWFMDRGGKVQVRRDYPDHPRWLSNDALGDKAARAIRVKMANAHIVSEIHMLARRSAGLPDYPAWIPAKLTIKAAEADLAYRLLKTGRDVFKAKGTEAMMTLADRAPAQFLKLIATMIDNRAAQDIARKNSGAALPSDKEKLAAVTTAILEELDRRAGEAKLLAVTHVGDYVSGDVVGAVNDTAKRFAEAADPGGNRKHLGREPLANISMPHKLKGVVDIMTVSDDVDINWTKEW